jgi:hypothetical protein
MQLRSNKQAKQGINIAAAVKGKAKETNDEDSGSDSDSATFEYSETPDKEISTNQEDNLDLDPSFIDSVQNLGTVQNKDPQDGVSNQEHIAQPPDIISGAQPSDDTTSPLDNLAQPSQREQQDRLSTQPHVMTNPVQEEEESDIVAEAARLAFETMTKHEKIQYKTRMDAVQQSQTKDEQANSPIASGTKRNPCKRL